MNKIICIREIYFAIEMNLLSQSVPNKVVIQKRLRRLLSHLITLPEANNTMGASGSGFIDKKLSNTRFNKAACVLSIVPADLVLDIAHYARTQSISFSLSN